jgi:hypothetical protein
VSLLRIERNGQLVGRALLWDTEQGYTLMDRVHPVRPPLVYPHPQQRGGAVFVTHGWVVSG